MIHQTKSKRNRSYSSTSMKACWSRVSLFPTRLQAREKNEYHARPWLKLQCMKKDENAHAHKPCLFSISVLTVRSLRERHHHSRLSHRCVRRFPGLFLEVFIVFCNETPAQTPPRPWLLGRVSAQWEGQFVWPNEATRTQCGDHGNLAHGRRFRH
jgi:hypothetical protein